MNRFILGLATLAGLSGALMFANPAQAAPIHRGGGHEVHRIHEEFRGYHSYRGIDRCLVRDYRGWSRTYWDARYRCNFYFSPEANAYYYWYAPGATYLPVSYAATYPPSVGVPAVAGVPVIAAPSVTINPLPIPVPSVSIRF